MATYTAQIQALYVAYFNRPADAAGLSYWDGVITANKGSTAAVSAAFAASAEYKAAYAGMDAYHVIATVYQNLFGHQPDTPGLNYWGQLLLNGKITVDNAVTQIAAGAQGTDLKAYQDKIAGATAFTNGLTTTAQQLGYSGDNANNLAKAWMATIVDDASLAAAIDPTALANAINTVITPVPVQVNLTTGIDTLVGTAANEVFNATVTGASPTLGAFDSIDGAGGNNTLSIVDTTAAGTVAIPGTVTIKNIQNLNIATTSSNGVTLDASGISSLTSVKLVTTNAAVAADSVIANANSAVNVSSAGGTVSVDGGTSVTVNAKGAVTVGGTTAPTGAVSVTTGNVAATAASTTAGAVNVTGGTTVNVTENLVAPTVTGTTGTAYAVTGGVVNVNGTATTTAVSVTQTAAVAAVAGVAAAAAVPAVAQVDTVTIGGTVATGDVFSVTIGATTYTYTAVAGDTTTQVAAGLAAAVGSAGATTAAASGSSVTLTANTAGTAFTATPSVTSAAATEAVAVTTANAAAVAAVAAVAPVGGIVDGAVHVTDLNSANTDGTKANTITTVTLDGYGAGSTVATNALSSLTLANSAKDVTVTDNSTKPTATTLALNVNNLASGATLNDAAIKTLNVTSGAAGSTLAVNAANATALTIAGAGKLTLNLTGATKLATIDGSTATGALTLSTGVSNTVTSIMTGSGNDTVTVNTATAAAVAATSTAAAIPAVNATVGTGAGNDKVTVNTSGTGATSIDTGAGNDTVNVTARSSGILTVTMGDGNDTFTSAVAINGTDVIDAGAGVDTLALSLVGAANIGAFANFDVFDAAGMAKQLDVDILASKNTVTEFVASGDVGVGASLINIGSGVGFRATGDMGAAHALQLTQKTAGALTVTLDADSTSTTAANNPTLNVDATNATSLKVVFGADSAFVPTSTVANTSTVKLQAEAATSLAVTTGGTNATDVLSYVDTAHKLATMTVTGAANIDITGLSGTTALTSIDASGLTGKLVVDLADLKAGAGTVTLGSAADTVNASAAASNATSFETVAAFQKAAATAIATTTTAADPKAIAAADQLVFTSAAVQADGGLVKNGVMTFTGAGPTTLANAIAMADAATTATGNAVVFEYLGNTYAFVQGGTVGTVDNTDIVVKLAGITGVTNFAENGTTDHFFLV